MPPLIDPFLVHISINTNLVIVASIVRFRDNGGNNKLEIIM